MLDNSVHPAAASTVKDAREPPQGMVSLGRQSSQGVATTRTAQSTTSFANGSHSLASKGGAAGTSEVEGSVLSRRGEADRETVDDEDLASQELGCMEWRSLAKVFRSKKFKNWKLERLFQLYFFKLNQNNLTVMMALMVVICTIQLIYHFVCGSKSDVKAVFISLFIVVLIVLQVLCNHSVFSQRLMTIVCWSAFAVAGAMVLTMTLDVVPRSASNGVSNTVFLIFILYTLLPVRMRLAVLSGIALSATHLASAAAVNHVDEFSWKQVLCSLKFHSFICFSCLFLIYFRRSKPSN